MRPAVLGVRMESASSLSPPGLVCSRNITKPKPVSCQLAGVDGSGPGQAIRSTRAGKGWHRQRCLQTRGTGPPDRQRQRAHSEIPLEKQGGPQGLCRGGAVLGKRVNLAGGAAQELVPGGLCQLISRAAPFRCFTGGQGFPWKGCTTCKTEVRTEPGVQMVRPTTGDQSGLRTAWAGAGASSVGCRKGRGRGHCEKPAPGQVHWAGRSINPE